MLYMSASEADWRSVSLNGSMQERSVQPCKGMVPRWSTEPSVGTDTPRLPARTRLPQAMELGHTGPCGTL